MSFDDVEFRHLRALRAVADEGSFVGAADVLGFSQAAISQQIAGLEKAVGTSLFDRPGGPKPVTLTPAGRVMLRHADAVVDRLTVAQRDLSDLYTGTAGRLVVGTYQSVSVQLLPELVREMRSASPDIDIHLVEHDDNESLVAALMNGDLDVTFLTAADSYGHRTVGVVLTGANGEFCSGADLSPNESAEPSSIHSMRYVADVVLGLHRMPKPTIASSGRSLTSATPMPSATSAPPKSMAKVEARSARRLGAMCQYMMRTGGTPTARAAST